MRKFSIRVDGFVFDVSLQLLPENGSGVTVNVDGEDVLVQALDPGAPPGELQWFIIDGRPIEIIIDQDFGWIETRWGTFPLRIEDQTRVIPRPQVMDGRVKAPIPGQVARIMVQDGDLVHAGQPLLILEAMKMENEIRAPRNGQIKMMNVEPGQRVTLNELLLEIE